MDQEDIVKLLDHYLCGNCSLQEKEWVEAWINDVDKNDNEWSRMTTEEQKRYLMSLYEDVRDHIFTKKDRSRFLGDKMRKIGRNNRVSIFRAAACLVALIGLSGLLYLYVPGLNHQSKPVSYRTVSTLQGKVVKLVLDDGTLVWLNAASKLRYAEKFDHNTRDVFLEGEAFFDVAKDPQKPFIIHCGKMKTRVLGTRLNVCAYPSEESIQIVVVSGKVEVGMVSDKIESDKMLLAANEMASYEKSTAQLSKRIIDNATDLTSWMDGTLAFHHTPMEEVMRELERAYPLKFSIENKAINHCEISGHFDIHQPAEQVIKAVCLSIGAHYKIKNRQVFVYGTGCE